MIEQHKADNPDLITYETARSLLGVAPRTLRLRILQDGLTRYRHPMDRRVKLLDRREVESLLEFEVVMPRQKAA